MASPYSAYRRIIGDTEHDLIMNVASAIKGLQVVMVNSTRDGGGVAEILRNMVPLLNELGIRTGWDVITGNAPFFEATKTLHNAIHGRAEPLTEGMVRAYWDTTAENAAAMGDRLKGDIIFIHDPQPAGLIRTLRGPGQKWIFRCHIDISSPYPPAWEFLGPLVEAYDATVFSHPSFSRRLAMPQFWIAPSIDPLADKNKPLPADFCRRILARFAIDPERPLVTQVSRFDKLKDPLGVIEAFRLVKKTHPDVQLLLAGGAASDDPESVHILPALQEAAAKDRDIHLLDLPPFSDLEINAIQRSSTVVLQKSLREGFALTVSEALWKERPVIATAVGGIPQQVIHGKTGWLVRTIEGTAHYIRRVLDNPEESALLGKVGREHVRRNFLITRHLREYMSMFICARLPGRNIVTVGPGFDAGGSRG